MGVPGETVKNIGFDPVRWVDRLRDVADESQFDQHQKDIIEHHLSELQVALTTYAAGRDAYVGTVPKDA